MPRYLPRFDIESELVTRALRLAREGRDIKPAVEEYRLHFPEDKRPSLVAIYKRLREVYGIQRLTRGKDGVLKKRKTRSDKGQSKLPDEQVMAVAGAIIRSKSAHDHKPTLTVTAVHGELQTTNSIVECSESTVRRRMVDLRVDPANLFRPEPHWNVSVPYPLYCLQIDASDPAFQYLRKGRIVYDKDEDMLSYKKKDEDAIRIKRVIIVDVFSRCVFVIFYAGRGEGVMDMLKALWQAMRGKGPNGEADARFPFCGVPEYLYSDKGPGLRNASAENVFDALDIEFMVHRKGNPRAKGLVETLMRKVESALERLILARGGVDMTLDKLNSIAINFCMEWNRTKKNGLLGMAPFDAFLQNIHRNPNGLVLPPDWDDIRAVAFGKGIKRRVNNDWTIRDNHNLYRLTDLRECPDVQPGMVIEIQRSAEEPGLIKIPMKDGSSYPVRPLGRLADGKPSDSAIFAKTWHKAPFDLATRARNIARNTPLPEGSGPNVAQKIEFPADRRASIRKAEIEARAHEMIPWTRWIKYYGEVHGVDHDVAMAVYEKLFGDPEHAPTAPRGAAEAIEHEDLITTSKEA